MKRNNKAHIINYPQEKLRKREHVRFFERCLKLVPQHYSLLDSQRMTIAFFSISGLDVLNSLDIFNENQAKSIINWIYSLQVYDDEGELAGFQGSTAFNYLKERSTYKCGAIAHTYTALSTLLILGDDLSRVHRQSIVRSLRKLQRPDGNFTASLVGSESDMRFVYCAACISYILDDWSGMDIDKTVEFILNSISYDFAIGQCPETESHGGSTFCAVATLALANRLDSLSQNQRDGLIRWLLMKQGQGFHGRPNKPDDTCYSFWVVAALKILNAFEFINIEKNREYIMTTQNLITGGFAKQVDNSSDALHTYFGLCGLSLMNEKGLKKIMPSLAISLQTAERLKSIHEHWRAQ
ncbi:geranylgeranyl transferase type-1 subunit beta [Chrysoperla carnea]|uniref:geranylgeranyl transferase type-1 subunit beta n=1 Tax=Chrysoperla carnea TaxID=189513 RepID=UPI001D0604AE|nr:geranylgeranyl transferase type-1 subunit beta [Chrysoperla carnea]